MALHNWNSASRDQSLDEKSRRPRVYLRSLAKFPVAPECVVADAVACEPVSVSEFPANREKNREFYKITALRAPVTANNVTITKVLTGIPYALEQGIILAEQGNLARVQGILLAEFRIFAG